MKIAEKYPEGSIVYLITDPDQLRRIVIGYDVRGGQIRYWLGCETEQSLHYEIEITEASDVKYRTSN